MSDDRFKQARRSLIDRHNQRQQQGGDSFEDDFEDEATAMVNLDAIPGAPQFAPPPNFSDDEEGDDERTEMITLGELEAGLASVETPARDRGGVQIHTHSGVQPTFNHFGAQQQAPPSNFPAQGQYDQGGGGYSPPPTEPGHDIGTGSPNQSLLLGGGGGYDANTQFVNLGEFADGETFTPDTDASGYEGSTQFVNIAALQAGAAQGGKMPIEHDPVLTQSYQFGPESIQHGDVTLVFAQNPAGHPVVLKRIWDGDPNGMPMPLRQRVTALDQIRHPKLISLNGMLASETGAWVDLPRPPGYRLTDILAQNGPQPEANAKEWLRQAADILGLIHQQGFVYASLTTDALWIQDDGSVILEPFDILEFEHRGNLGIFGPPELNFPPEQRQLYPATDIYSLAVVYLAATTGMPVNLQAAQSLDKKTGAAIQQALQQNPQDRPQSMADFIGAFSKKGGGVQKPPMKIIIAAAAVLGILILGGAFFFKQQQAKKAAEQAQIAAANNAAAEDAAAGTAGIEAVPTGTNAGAAVAAGTNGAEAKAEAPKPAVDVGAFEEDPRLKVTTSLRLNPPPEVGKVGRNPAAADQSRKRAREALEDVEKLTDKGKSDAYKIALTEMASAVRAAGGPSPADRAFLEELAEIDSVKTIQREYFEKLDSSINSGNMSRVKSVYPLLAAIDADADEMDFFDKNKRVEVQDLPSHSAPAAEEDEEEEDDE